MKLLLLTLCFTVTLLEVSSYQCYNCAAQLTKGEECEKDIEKSPTNECYNGGVCGAYIIKKQDNVQILTRGCLAKDICNILKKRLENNQEEILEKCETCESEQCNKVTYTGSKDRSDDDDSSSAALFPSVILSCVLLVSLSLYQ